MLVICSNYLMLPVLQQVLRQSAQDGPGRCQRVSNGHPHLPPNPGARHEVTLLRNALFTLVPFGK